MSNHVHLLMTPQTAQGISKVMQSVGRYYVQYFNHQYQRTGTLWAGRYKSTLLDSENYLLTCYRYIELNPVRAGMVDHPVDYPWSSYHYNALAQKSTLIAPHELYLKLGQDDAMRCYHYRALFDAHIDPRSLDEIRNATNKSWVLGSDHFMEQIEALTARQSQPKARGGDRKPEKYRQAKINRV